MKNVEPCPFDVVVVPDFSGPRAAAFAARTLFFLASWLTGAGSRKKRDEFPLHVACIGEPPGSVQRLGERAGAAFHVFPPLVLDARGTTNKLRGLEIVPRTGRTLLLDADVLVLGPPAALAGQVPADHLAAAPAGHPRVPAAGWAAIYERLDLPPPTERPLSARAAHGLEPAGRGEMFPFFNSGVLLVPGGRGLRQTWEDDLRRLAASGLVGTPLLPAPAADDMPALATAIHRWRLAGGGFTPLPDAWHARPLHFQAGALGWEHARLFHAVGFLREVTGPAEVAGAVEAYAARWRGWSTEGGERRAAGRDTAWGRAFVRRQARRWGRRATDWLRALWRDHVQPALEKG